MSKRPGIVLWSRARLFRNLKGHSFISSDTGDQCVSGSDGLRQQQDRKSILKEIESAVAELSDKKKMKLVKLSSISDSKIIELYEKGALSVYHKKMVNDDSRGIITGAGGVVYAMVNERHHLVLQVLRPGFQLERVWNEVDRLDDLFGSRLKYAWSKKFGYLMPDSECCGAGLDVTVNVHLPGLILMGEMQEVVSAFGAVGLTLDAEISHDVFIEGFGQLLRISNNMSVPDSEEVFLRKIERAVSGLVLQEAQAGLRALKDDRTREMLYNKVVCSLAVLKNALIMERAQSHEEISWLRTGIAMGLVEGMTLVQVDRLHKDIWSSNFLLSFSGSFEEAVQHVGTTRAAVLRERLKDVKVNFM